MYLNAKLLQDSMKTILTFIAIIFTGLTLNAQTLYTKTYGNPKDKPLLFLHGGPGYNAVNFEQSTADKLSKNGYYVIVNMIDVVKEGRSTQMPSLILSKLLRT